MYILQCVYLAVTLCIFISEYCVYSEYFNIKVYYVIILFQFIIPGKSWLYTVIIFTELVCVHFFYRTIFYIHYLKKKKYLHSSNEISVWVITHSEFPIISLLGFSVFMATYTRKKQLTCMVLLHIHESTDLKMFLDHFTCISTDFQWLLYAM